MKHVLLLYLLWAFALNLSNCDCGTDCHNRYQQFIRGLTDQDTVCGATMDYLDCLYSHCYAYFPPIIAALNTTLAESGFVCDFSAYDTSSGSSSESVALSSSMFVVFGFVLIAAYRTL